MTSSEQLVEVRLLEVPVELRGRSLQHGEELLREMALISQDSETRDAHGSTRPLPDRLLALAHEVRTTYGALAARADEQYAEAVARGDTYIDALVYQLPITIGPFIRHLIEILDEADDYCRAGQHLLTLATPADVAAYRHWSLTEIERQLAGGAPTSWPDYSASGTYRPPVLSD